MSVSYFRGAYESITVNIRKLNFDLRISPASRLKVDPWLL